MKRLRLPPVVANSVLAVTLFALTLGTVLLRRECGCPFPWWGSALIAGQTLPLALRRRAPVPVWAIAGIFTAIYGASNLDDPPIFFGGLVALYTVASLSSRRTSYVAAAITAVSIAVSVAASGDTAFVTLAFNVVVFATAWILGDSVRVHRAYTAELEARAVRLERDRREEAARAAAEERVRIARELHEVVAHHVSVIALQSQAAEVLLPADPDRAAGVVADIGLTARQALAELRRLLGALREDDDRAPALAPQPGVDDLDALVAAVRRAGLAVDVSVEGEARPLPAGIGLSAYRIVQEALTNVLKHAHADRAHVTLRFEDDQLLVCVTDDGTGGGQSPPPNGQGQGLIGMRERVALIGGELTAGVRPDGGFRVEARLPVRGL